MDGNATLVGMLGRNDDMCVQWTTSLGVESVYKTALLVFAVCITSCRLGSFGGDVRSRSKEIQCVRNMRTLYCALVKYISLYGHLPHGQNGQVSIDPLTDTNVQDRVGLEASVLRCPSDGNTTRPSYVLNPALCIADLGPESATVIACERTPNHYESRTQNHTRIVLIGDGSSVVMDLPRKDQEEWYRLFLLGNKRACTVHATSGAKGNWASSNIMWYVGQQQGYVPNE